MYLYDTTVSISYYAIFLIHITLLYCDNVTVVALIPNYIKQQKRTFVYMYPLQIVRISQCFLSRKLIFNYVLTSGQTIAKATAKNMQNCRRKYNHIIWIGKYVKHRWRKLNTWTARFLCSLPSMQKYLPLQRLLILSMKNLYICFVFQLNVVAAICVM